jgi:hypothetical protein
LNIHDVASSKAYYYGNVTAQNLPCTAWIDLLNDTGYASGQWFGAQWFVVSPSSSQGSWSYDCQNCASQTGNCWSDSTGISLQRTCK